MAFDRSISSMSSGVVRIPGAALTPGRQSNGGFGVINVEWSIQRDEMAPHVGCSSLHSRAT